MTRRRGARDPARAAGHDVRPRRRRYVRPRLSRHRGRARRRAGASRGDAAHHAVAPRRRRRRANSAPEVDRHRAEQPARVRQPVARRVGRCQRAPTCWRWARACWPTSCPARPAPGSARSRRAIGWSSPTPSAPRRRRCAASAIADRRAADRLGRGQPPVHRQLRRGARSRCRRRSRRRSRAA